MQQTYLENHIDLVTAESDTPGIAFFDLDRTLIAGYSIIALAWERIRQGVSRAELADSLKILRESLSGNKATTIAASDSYHRLVQLLSASLKGIPEHILSELGEHAYRNVIEKGVYREAISLIEAHRAAGHHIVIVSAASRYQIDPVARVLGIQEVCCTELEVVDGCFTGHTRAPLCFGQGKVTAARRIGKKLDISLDACWFYSDSSDDLPLLQAVGHPVAVNPSDTLATSASANGWPRLNFASRGFPTAETLLRTALTAQAVAATTAVCAIGKRLKIGRVTNTNTMTRLLGEVGSGLAGLDLEIEGSEHLRQQRPAVFIFNHQSLLDALVMSHLLREDVVALAKKEMAGNPLLGPLLRQVDTIFVDREDKDQTRVLKEALAVIASGRSLLIAPEGTRSTLGEIQPFKHGAFFIAKKARVPVIPVVLHNVKDALQKGGFLIRATTIRVTVLPPMHPENIGGVRKACEKMEQRYTRVLADSNIAALPYQALEKIA